VVTVAADGPAQLRAIDLDHATVHDVCTFADIERVDALAFLPDDRLVGSDAATTTLWIGDPCDCALTFVAPLEPPLSLHAMAEAIEAMTPTAIGADGMRGGLFGAELDEPHALVLAELPLASSLTALAAASEGSELYALVVTDGMHLMRIEPSSGTIVADAAVDLPSHATGLTLAPDQGSLLACDDDGALWRLEQDGSATAPIDVALTAPCRTLAAPHGTVECIDALLEP
jgi:hypothetical protein